MKPITKVEQQNIIKSLRAIYQTGDINQLTEEAYNFVNILSGFIAHYNLLGFRDEYDNLTDRFFRQLFNSYDVVARERFITDRYFSTGNNTSYYKSKYEILCDIANLEKEVRKTADI